MWIIDLLRGLFAKKHKKAGLALGSGGAKGAALIGALRVFEEEGISFDIVAGTSIGSIVGALYALGYSSADMMNVIKSYGVTELPKILAYKLKGYTVTSLLDKMLGEKYFEDVSMPFAAVATNIVTGGEVDISRGKLSIALAASSAIPPFFKPVTINDQKLIDGAFVNAVPADVVKKMGADVVISINLSSSDLNEASLSVLNGLYKTHGVKACNRLEKGRAASDYMLEPDIGDFLSTDIDKIDEMYYVGYTCAKEHIGEIKALLKKHKIVFGTKK